MIDQTTLLNRRVQIRLTHENEDIFLRRGKCVPDVAVVAGTCVRRCFFLGWGYVVALDERLFLDQDGILTEARRKYSTSYLFVHLVSTDIYNGKDPLFLELTGRASRMMRGDELSVVVRYAEAPEQIPNEISKNDEFLKKIPSIGFGWIKLIN